MTLDELKPHIPAEDYDYLWQLEHGYSIRCASFSATGYGLSPAALQRKRQEQELADQRARERAREREEELELKRFANRAAMAQLQRGAW